MNVAVILASGIGQRYGSSIPKQYVKLNGIPVINYVLTAVTESNQFDCIFVVMDNPHPLDGFNFVPVQGGKTRNESVNNALDACNYLSYREPFIGELDKIVFFDAVRPLLKASDIKPYLDGLETHNAVITVENIKDSLITPGNMRVDRSHFHLVQTPEAFRYNDLYESFNIENEYTAIYQHLPSTSSIKYNFLSHYNNKITYPQDLYIMEHLIKHCPYIPNNSKNFKGKKVIIFGAYGGLGKVLVTKFNEAGAIVIGLSHQNIDISKDFSLEGLSDADIVINVAGAYHSDNEGILETYDSIMDTNIKGTLRIITQMSQNRQPNHKSNLVLVSSSSATKGRPGITVYSASKVALHSIVESLSMDYWKKFNIAMNVICPEKIDTPLVYKLHGSNVDKRELLSPEEVCEAIMSYCNTELHGQIVHIRKGFNYDS